MMVSAMPTDKERREVAARLRELPDIPSEMGTWEGGLMFIEPSRADEADYSQIHKVLFGCLPADLMHPCDYEELHARLADLIEPEERTCRNIADESYREFGEPFKCSECGADPHDGENFFCGFSSGEYDWRFCPNCGARVVQQ